MSEVKHTPTEGVVNDAQLVAFLRREGRHSGVWFSDQLMRAADRLEARTNEALSAVNSHGDLVEALRDASRLIKEQADLLIRCAEDAGHPAKPVPSLFHAQARYFVNIAEDIDTALSKVLELGEGL